MKSVTAILSFTAAFASTSGFATAAAMADHHHHHFSYQELHKRTKKQPVPGQITSQGCFNSSGVLVLANNNLPFNTDGNCGIVCQNKNKPVSATHGGQECWCGEEYPKKSSLTDDSACDVPCTGFSTISCGGLDTWNVYNTGIKLAVRNSPEDAPSSSVPPGSSPTGTPTSPPASGVPSTPNPSSGNPTAPPGSSPTDGSDNGGQGGGAGGKIGLIVGVVVAVVVASAIVGTVLWFLRRKRNQEIEEEHRRTAAVNAFMTTNHSPVSSSDGNISMIDSRLDPVMAHRRMSDGSIADNQDYSRKILRVTNA